MHPEIDATDIDVQVRESEVILSGAVDDRHAKRLAEELVENISGVKDVNNQIRVRRTTEDRDRGQGLGSGFDTTTGNRGESPLGLNQQGQQRSGQESRQYSGQQSGQYTNRPQTGQQYGGQQGNQQTTQQPQYSGGTQNTRR